MYRAGSTGGAPWMFPALFPPGMAGVTFHSLWISFSSRPGLPAPPPERPSPCFQRNRPPITPIAGPIGPTPLQFSTLRVARSSSSGRGCGCSPHPSSARPGRAPAARPILPSRLRPCRSPRRSSPGSAPPTCSPCQSRVSPTPAPSPSILHTALTD